MSDVAVYTPLAIKEEFDLECEQMIDFKALTGDPVIIFRNSWSRS